MPRYKFVIDIDGSEVKSGEVVADNLSDARQQIASKIDIAIINGRENEPSAF